MKKVYTERSLMWRYNYFCSRSLKVKSTLSGMMLIILSFLIPFSSLAQQPVGSSTVKANFGVDADVYANRLQFPPLFGPPFPVPAVGTDDFFENQTTDPGPGMGVIGTTAATVDPDHWNKISAAQYKATYCQSASNAMRNHTYIQRMAQPFGFNVGPIVWLDAVGARDNFSAGNQVDSSTFNSGSNKNGDNPLTWNVGIGGTPAKNDIIDVGAHIRYDFSTNPEGDLWGFAYATTLSADGNSFLDFEIYRAPVTYDPATGFSDLQWVNPGLPNGNYLDSAGFEGGHTAGLHALDGTTLRPGDLMIAVDFLNGGTNPQFSVRIWVDPNNLTPWDMAPMDTAQFNQTVNKPFTFTGEFADGDQSGTYGWAEIVPNDLTQPLVFGRVNIESSTTAAPWGNLSGSQATCDDNYEELQLAELGINFTAFGLGINPPSGPCFTLFGTLLVKTRSSASFTAELKDFSGPYIFGNFSSVQVTVNNDTIDCDSTTAYLCANAVASSPGTLSYVWMGPDIISYSADSSCIVVGAAGDYTVQVTLNGGCFESATATVIDNSVPATCSIDPAGPFCPGTTNQHCGPAGQTAYQWSITGNGTIQGSSTSQCVTVLAGATCGSYTLELIVGEDACEDTCDMTFQIEDLTAPVISGVGQNATIECPATPSFSSPTASDNCDATPTLTFNDVTTPGACPQEFSVTRTWTATDACGNSSTASQTINVTDNTAPVITGVGQNATIECPATPQFSSPNATDACDPNPSLTFNDVTTPGACPQEFSVTRTWTATDACGNSSIASQTINVTDNTAPVITGVGQNATIECPATPQFSSPNATDACDPNPSLTFNDVTTPGACPQEFSVTRTWTATDACGNSSTASQTINVTDNTAPVITGVGQNATIECPATPQFSSPNATDACDPNPSLTFNDVTTPGACPQEFSVTRTWTATDACGNSSTASQTINVTDNTAPVITGVGQNATIECPATPVFSSPNATDACDPNPSLTFNDVTTPGACPQEFSVTRTWTATDACGNSSTASQTINVTDNTAPVISGVGSNSSVECPATPVFSSPSASDLCDPAPSLTFNDVTTPGACPQEYSVTRTWTATDACGNSSTASQTINVTDNTAPVIICAADGIVACGGTVTFTAPTATDNCTASPVITVLSTTTTANGNGTISHVRTWTVTDECGNTATCSQTLVEQACEGCTPGFWKNHTLIWDQSSDAVSQCIASAAASLGYGGNGTTSALYRVTFGLTAAQMSAVGLPANLTLHQALNTGGGGFKKLARHSVASLLNSCAISFGMTTTGVLTAVHNAFTSGNAEPTAENFVGLNEQNCPLGGPGTFDPHQPKGKDKNNKVSAYPNPFNSSTTITFKLDVDTNVSLDVYSLNGAKVATLYEGVVVGGQAYNVTFKGETLHEGIYIYKLNTPDQSYFDKLILIK